MIFPKRYRVDAVTYAPLEPFDGSERPSLMFEEVGRIPGGMLYRWHRTAKQAADSYDRWWELTFSKGGHHTRYEVVDTLRFTRRQR